MQEKKGGGGDTIISGTTGSGKVAIAKGLLKHILAYKQIHTLEEMRWS